MTSAGRMYNHQLLEQGLCRVIEILQTESSRELDEEGRTGGVVRLDDYIYTILIPDLHGRCDFLKRSLLLEIDGVSLLDRLEQQTAQMVCVGDGMHAEARAAKRWRQALQEYLGGYVEHAAMFEEMDENFSTMQLVMDLKGNFPEHFHFLKGNHENIKDESGNGNHPFAKFAAEGPMTRKFVEKYYGTPFLELWDRFEKNLPLVAYQKKAVVSHARPRRAFLRSEIVNYHTCPEVIEGLTWTRDPLATPGCAKEIMAELSDEKDPLWFCGHTAIGELYKFWEKEGVIQFHNPRREPVVVLHPDIPFQPAQHILDLQCNQRTISLKQNN